MMSEWCHDDAMDLTPFVDSLRRELAVAADTGGDDGVAVAERLTAPLAAATRLILLDALSAAADEITRDLAPGSVHVRLRGLDPDFVVTPPASDRSFEDATESSVGHATGDGGALEAVTSRINLRLPEPLKLRVEEAASRESLSVNAWLVRAVAATLEPNGRDRRSTRRGTWAGQHYTGWVN